MDSLFPLSFSFFFSPIAYIWSPPPPPSLFEDSRVGKSHVSHFKGCSAAKWIPPLPPPSSPTLYFSTPPSLSLFHKACLYFPTAACKIIPLTETKKRSCGYVAELRLSFLLLLVPYQPSFCLSTLQSKLAQCISFKPPRVFFIFIFCFNSCETEEDT